MPRYAIFLTTGVIIVIIGYFGLRLATIISTTDYYYGTITQEPKVGATGEREISLLAAVGGEAETLTVSDFCAIPFTDYCQTDSANLHGTFIARESYCVAASGVRFGWFSWKPNIYRIVTDADDDYGKCIAVGAP